MNRIDTKKLLLGISVILLPMISISTSVYLFLESREVKGVSTERAVPKRLVPYISNVVPNVAYIGEEYTFVPKVVSEDGSDTVVTLAEGPKWLLVDEEGIVRGTPLADDTGTKKVVLKVSDGYNSSTLVEYLVVENNEKKDIDNN